MVWGPRMRGNVPRNGAWLLPEGMGRSRASRGTGRAKDSFMPSSARFHSLVASF